MLNSPSPPLLAPTSQTFLLLSSPTLSTASLLSELFLSSPSLSSLTIDAVLALAPDASELGDGLQRGTGEEEGSEEELAGRNGIMTCLLGQLENIVCRTIYLPTISSSLRLTPNSRSVSDRWLKLANGLGVMGIAEPSSLKAVYDDIDGVDSDDDLNIEDARRAAAEAELAKRVEELRDEGEADGKRGRGCGKEGGERGKGGCQTVLVTTFCGENNRKGEVSREFGFTSSHQIRC